MTKFRNAITALAVIASWVGAARAFQRRHRHLPTCADWMHLGPCTSPYRR